MRLAVVGSRTFTDYDMMDIVLSEMMDKHGKALVIVTGGAKGADKMAEFFAYRNGLQVQVYKPDWEKYGKSAGFRRNRLIVGDADMLLAFYGPDGETKGTASSIGIAREKGIPFFVFHQEST